MEFKIMVITLIVIQSFIQSYEAKNIFPNRYKRQLNQHLLASPADCNSTMYADYQYGGREAHLRDYRWMALVGKYKGGQFKPLCSGFLISHRYILTASNCALLMKRDSGIFVRLGEHDLNTDIDCRDGFCLDPVTDVGVEEAIYHQGYPDGIRRQHLIGLARLSKEVPYNNNISPICLPSTVGSPESKTGTGLLIAGWGATERHGEPSHVKLVANLPIYDHLNCSKIHERYGAEGVTEFQICAGGNSESTCQGDSGIPLMKLDINHFWVVEGIDSYGRSCNETNEPAIFSRVSKYDNWIRENIKP